MELIEKAQAFLDNKSFSDQVIADKVGVKRMMIHRYRAGTTKLENAKYYIVRNLANEYDNEMGRN